MNDSTKHEILSLGRKILDIELSISFRESEILNMQSELDLYKNNRDELLKQRDGIINSSPLTELNLASSNLASPNKYR